jgi:anti-sigma B factor antagonist
MRITTLTKSRAEQIAGLAGLSMVSRRVGDVHVLSLDGELDLATSPSIERELRRIEATEAGMILVDLADVTFIDSTGIRLLAAAAGRLRRDGRLVINRPGPSVLRVLRMAGVADLLPLRA